MTARMHLISFQIHSPINHTTLSWADGQDQRIAGLGSIAYWQEVAWLLEKGGFDGVFFADTPGTFDHFRDRTDEAVKYGVCWPQHDPMALVGVMAAATRHLGIAITLSITQRHPFTAVRELSTLDHLTGGRVGWNIVTGHMRAEYRALGQDQVEHDERYDRADEYMAVCNALWSGIAPDALKFDKATGVLADPAKVTPVDFKGRYYSCRAVPPVLPSPQGRPVLFQAGSSGRGQQFAVRHADVMMAIQPHVPAMQRYMTQLKAAAEAGGRKEAARVVFAVQPILGGSEAEAKRRQQEIEARIPLEAALARLSGSLGVDFSRLDPDKPFEELETQASRGLMSAMAMVFDNRRFTLREAAMRWGLAAGMPQIVGTPEQVADRLETIWRETGGHGFVVSPVETPGSIRAFVEEVVPILVKRGLHRTDYAATTFRGNVI